MAKLPFMIRHDNFVAVFRPENPDLALQLAKALVGAVERGSQTSEENSSAFGAILHAQPYRLVGLASVPQGKATPRVLDEQGWVIGKMVRGDSYGPWHQITALRESGVEFKIGDELPRQPSVDA